MPETAKNISDSVNWHMEWAHPLMFAIPEMNELTEAGFFGGGTSLVRTPFRQDNHPGGGDPAFSMSTTFWIPLSGHLKITSASGTVEGGPGNLFLRPLYIRHRVEISGDFHHIYFRCRNLQLNKIAMYPFPDAELASLVVEKLSRESLERGPYSGATIRHLAGLLFQLLERTLTLRSARIDQLMTLLIKSPAVLWNTSKLARKLNMSDSLLYKLCRVHYGRSPTQLIREVKMRQADELMATGRPPLEDVARRLGYSSAFAFSKAYFQTTGRRPGRRA